MRGYSENADGDVVLTMSRDDWECVLHALGYATGATLRRHQQVSWLQLANRLNEGNPRFKQYEISEEEKKDDATIHGPARPGSDS